MRYFLSTILLLLFLSCDFSTLTFAEKLDTLSEQQYKVVSVKDGDTIGVLMDGKEVKIRFNHIDCPEKSQPFGKKAKQFVSDHCYGKMVRLKGNKKDRYGRILAEVFLPNKKNLNKELVKNGLAWHFTKYSSDKDYAQLEQQARKKKIGLWSEPNPVAPWDWRKERRK